MSDNFSLGFGGDYSYNKGDFDIKGNWGSSAKGHSDNIGIFSNFGYKTFDNTFLSAHLRGDSHKYSQENLTYRLNITKLTKNFDISLSESTGLRHPDLFVLHGSNPSGTFKSMKTTKPETSLTREISAKLKFNDNISFESNAYKSHISDVLNRSTSTGGYNEIIDINQEGLENNFTISGKDQKISLFNSFSKSREGNGKPQLRRPEKQFGIKFNKLINSKFFGSFDLNYDYRHVRKVEDWKNGSVRAKVDSSDIMDLRISKSYMGKIWSLNFLNLTNENYQRPDTYNQEGRRLELSFRYNY